MSNLKFSAVFGTTNNTLFVRVSQKGFKKLAGTNIMVADNAQTKSGFIEVPTEKDQEELIAVLESGAVSARFGKTPNDQGAYPIILVESGASEEEEPATSEELEHE